MDLPFEFPVHAQPLNQLWQFSTQCPLLHSAILKFHSQSTFFYGTQCPPTDTGTVKRAKLKY